ncbi:MAG: MetQ/NlpA family ABC transporter substrate-binding protein [Defluviitaleaceae bacterium]|nr:MetQ/NlpA family ABC transporter substrate-binding protein [Defluviitaleaceae bacterium]
MKKLFGVAVVAVVTLLVFAACGGRNDENTLVIGATAVPHYEILEQVVDAIADRGFSLQIEELSDFTTPNHALNDGSLDANFFQHRPFLNNFNENNGTTLVPVFGVHFEPLRVFIGRSHSLVAILDGLHDGAEIAIPDDPTNEARALQLLEFLGLITLHEATRSTASATTGIAENPHNLRIRPVVAQTLPALLQDVDFAVINGNVALQGGVTHLAIEGASEEHDPNARLLFTNYVVVRDGYQNDERILALIDALDTEEIRDFIYEQYQGRIIPTLIRP